jgi:glycosyltransferase involved in cell wall biosynthesis
LVDIAYIVPSRIPGTAANAIHTMKMAQALLEIDPELITITAKGEGEYSETNIESLYGLTKVPDLVRLSAAGRYGIHLFNLRAACLARVQGARRVLSRSIGAAAMTAKLGLPTIYECHAPPSGFERKYWNLLTQSKNFRRMVVISDALRELVFETLPDSHNFDVIVAHDGVDLDRFRDLDDAGTAKHKAGRDLLRPVAGYAGHLYSGRGIEIILACAKALPDWDFVIAGGTKEDVQNYADEARQHNLTNIEFWGFVPNGALAKKLAIADVLLMPYQKSVAVSGGTLDTAQWMSPLKMFEYMAMKRTIIASDLAVLREVLDSQIAILVEPDNATAWVKALTTLVAEDKRILYSTAAAQAAQQYDWRKRANYILSSL